MLLHNNLALHGDVFGRVHRLPFEISTDDWLGLLAGGRLGLDIAAGAVGREKLPLFVAALRLIGLILCGLFLGLFLLGRLLGLGIGLSLRLGLQHLSLGLLLPLGLHLGLLAFDLFSPQRRLLLRPLLDLPFAGSGLHFSLGLLRIHGSGLLHKLRLGKFVEHDDLPLLALLGLLAFLLRVRAGRRRLVRRRFVRRPRRFLLLLLLALGLLGEAQPGPLLLPVQSLLLFGFLHLPEVLIQCFLVIAVIGVGLHVEALPPGLSLLHDVPRHVLHRLEPLQPRLLTSLEVGGCGLDLQHLCRIIISLAC
mmetsp:Transcript_31623/g.80210  ORF Transcript_31623/g.80210 Transcript_31623/m.80210 type:complete len:307 (-) Transcript_31623:158-1078(-)